MPRELLLNDLIGRGKVDLGYYIELKKKYRVSAQALIVRANQIGAITANQYQYLMRQISQNNYRKSEPLDDAYQLILPRYLKHAMNLIRNEKKISGNAFMELLKSHGISLQKSMVEKILNLEEGFLFDEIAHEDKIVLITR